MALLGSVIKTQDGMRTGGPGGMGRDGTGRDGTGWEGEGAGASVMTSGAKRRKSKDERGQEGETDNEKSTVWKKPSILTAD